MTDKNYTHLLCVVDRSGSMSGYEKDMVGGMNTMFEEQAKLDGKCLVDYVQFDTEIETVFADTPAGDAKAELAPRGATALLDAMGQSITDLGRKFKKLDEDKRPGTVIVIIVTDGYENSSREWSNAKVKELITRQEDEWNWNFTFLGANMDAVAVGANFGVRKDSALTFTQGNESALFASASTYVTNTRSGIANAYTDEDRKANAEA